MMATSQAATSSMSKSGLSSSVAMSGSMSAQMAKETNADIFKSMAATSTGNTDAANTQDSTEPLTSASPVATAAASASLTTEQKDKLKQGMAINQSVQESATVKADGLPSGVLPPVPLMTACGTQGQIAVTYSEGPSDATARIVKQLNAANAKATFFINATWLYSQQYAMVVQNTYNAGHFIGMTYRVKNDDSSVLSEEEIRNDIIKDAKVIQSLINVAPKYVRLHYTAVEDTKTENILKELGMVLVGYNLDSQDYSKGAKIQDVYKTAFQKQKETYDAKGSFISIQYDIPDTSSLESMSYILNTINDEGYTMVRMDGCLNDPNPYRKDAASNEYVADKFTFNSTGYVEGQTPMQRGVIIDEDGTETKVKTTSGAIITSISLGAIVAHLIIVMLGLHL
ncbi:hypothetical protein BGW37DRAFT_182510 [Umbelopsis sp. PMI_123]|nr:hypothetical protein BGW37DRAFT_182510 [Umbelopsis sp. PMI_123]